MSATPKPEDTRAHPRYLVRDQQLARVKLANNQTHAIRDLSYSGFSIDATIDRMSSDQVQISIFDTSVEAFVTLAHSNGKFAGFTFQHRTVGPLIFLQPFIERLRVGSTLVPLTNAVLDEKYRTGDWLVLRGDGPTDLKIKLNQNELEAVLLTFKDADRYAELRYRNQKVFTAKQVDDIGVSPRMAETNALDRTLVRQGAFILVGLQDERLKALLKPVLTLCKSA